MQCCICLQEATDPEKLFCCSNQFCASCLRQWKQVRNACPLCGTQIGTEKINILKNMQNEEFDNGSLMLETQIKESKERTKWVRRQLKLKKQESNNLKSSIQMNHLSFLQDQMYLVDEYYLITEQSFLKNQRITCVNHLQLIAEIILKMEAVLNGQQIQQIQQQYGYDDYEEDYYSYQDDYEDFEVFQKKLNKNPKGRETKSDYKEKLKSKKNLY